MYYVSLCIQICFKADFERRKVIEGFKLACLAKLTWVRILISKLNNCIINKMSVAAMLCVAI